MGSGRKREEAEVSVDIPAGVSDGMELRVQGAGNSGVAGGGPGDLFVRIEIEPSRAFERHGQDLHAVLDIPTTTATLGGDVAFEGLDGTEEIRVDAGTPSGTVLRLKGKGVPNLQRRGRGDLFVTLHVVTPTSLSREERKLVEKLADLRGERGGIQGDLRRPEF
jgi:molecular chaperone DnaJ